MNKDWMHLRRRNRYWVMSLKFAVTDHGFRADPDQVVCFVHLTQLKTLIYWYLLIFNILVANVCWCCFTTNLRIFLVSCIKLCGAPELWVICTTSDVTRFLNVGNRKRIWTQICLCYCSAVSYVRRAEQWKACNMNGVIFQWYLVCLSFAV